MEKTMNVPELRFRQFMPGGGYDSSRQDLNNWNKYKLEQISTIFDGTHSTPNYKKSGVPFYSVENIKDLKTNKYISIDEFHKNFKNNKPKYNDIFMTRIGDIGSTNIIETDDDIAYYVSLALIRSNENIIDPFYLMYQITDPVIQDELWKRTLHVAFPKKINKDEIGKIPVSVTSITEQKRIGIFFQKLDHLIQLQQQKVERLNQLKRGYLQKMFPHNNDLIPRLRFNDFNEYWIKYRIKEIGEVSTGNTPSTKNYEYYSKNGIPWITPSDIKSIVTSNSSKKLSYEGEKYAHLIYRNAVLITSIASIGKNTILDSDIAGFNQQINAIQPNNKIYPYFLITDSFNWIQVMNRIAGDANMKIVNKSDFSNIKIIIPNIKEQKKIGDLFFELDNLINVQNKKNVELGMLKQGYLQKLFC